MALDFTKPFVGFHARIGDHNAVGKLIDFIENHLAPMDFNAVIIELNPGYAYRCFPQYATGTVTYEDLQAIAAACRRCGIKPIPLIQSLSHQSDQSENSPFGTGPWPLFREHPEFLETKRLPDDAGWPDLYVYTWCPSNDGIYDYFFPMMDEIIEAFGADTVHVGLDEVFDIAAETCPRCAGKDPAALFARTVKILHDHLAEKGIQMMMWGDRLLDAQKLGIGMWEADRFGIYPAFDRTDEVTRDIVICDWHYEHSAFNFPSVEQFMKGGFTVIPCMGFRVECNKEFWKYCTEYIYLGNKYHWPGKVGGTLFTHWTPLSAEGIDEIIAGMEGTAPDESLSAPHTVQVGASIREIEPTAKYLRK